VTAHLSFTLNASRADIVGTRICQAKPISAVESREGCPEKVAIDATRSNGFAGLAFVSHVPSYDAFVLASCFRTAPYKRCLRRPKDPRLADPDEVTSRCLLLSFALTFSRAVGRRSFKDGASLGVVFLIRDERKSTHEESVIRRCCISRRNSVVLQSCIYLDRSHPLRCIYANSTFVVKRSNFVKLIGPSVKTSIRAYRRDSD